MTVWIGPEAAPQAHTVQVRDASPWQAMRGSVLRGMGGRTVTVWTGQAPESGQRITLRCPPDDLPGLLATLRAPGRLVLSTDEPTCPILTGPGVARSTRASYVYGVVPPAADVEVEWEWVTP